MTAGQIRAPTCIPLRATPGSKQNIDDETPIELSCDTSNTTIFYTINAEKPVPFDNKDRNTYTYSGPFLLMPGKRTIKSIAAYEDGRASNVVTKVYYVRESCPVEEMESLSLNSQIASDRSFDQSEDNYKRRVLAESFRHNIQTLPAGGLYTANRAKLRNSTSPSPASPTSAIPRASTPNKIPNTPNRKRRSLKIAHDVMRQVRVDDDPIQANITFTKETDKCPQCFTDKPPNPLSKYCHQCAHYLPPYAIEPGTVKCLHCHSVIPSDLPNCVVCNAILTSQQLNLPTTDAIVCGGCKFKNPPASKTCVVCEEKLELTIQPPHRPPPANNIPDQNKRPCGKCSRDNSLKARYCDWCGGSMVDLSQPLPCNSCMFKNPPLALYCGNCGLSLLPAERTGKVCWLDEVPVTRDTELVMRPPEPILISTDTQTEGIFYKSARRMQAEENKITDNMRQVYRSRGLSITKYSPGAGNWRQNVEHITNHIKVYSQLNSEYQDIIGKHQFGKVTMATLFKDVDEVHVSYVFSTKRARGSISNRPATPTRRSRSGPQAVLSSTPNKRSSMASSTSLTSELSDLMQEELRAKKSSSLPRDTTRTGIKQHVSPSDWDVAPKTEDLPKTEALSKSDLLSNGEAGEVVPVVEDEAVINKETKLRKSVRRKGPVKDMHDLRIGKLNSQLLQEIIKEGDEQRVTRMLGQGADANTKSSGGVSLLCLAAKNKHFGAVKALLDSGADVDYTVPSTKDTPLHVAVQQGAQDIVKYLVQRGADFSQTNTAGKSALDVARERHNQRAVQLFTASMGSNLLGLKCHASATVTDMWASFQQPTLKPSTSPSEKRKGVCVSPSSHRKMREEKGGLCVP